MPPANSPSDTPFGYSTAHSPYLDQLQELDTPVPDLASTLTTQAEDEADEDNVSFLRSRSRYYSDAAAGPTGRRRQPHFTPEEYDRIQLEHQRRLLRTISGGLPQQSPAREQDSGDASDPAYGDRIPQQQSLYDWAPGSSDDEDEGISDRQLRILLDQQSQSRRRQRDADARNRVPTAHPSRMPELSQSSQPPSDSSLRTAALLQSVRRQGRYSSRSRNQLQSYILERERTGHEATEENSRPSSARPQRTPNPITTTTTQQQQQQQRELRARVEAYRQRYIENPSSNMPAVSRWLEETIKYLERLRFSNSYEESLCAAAAGGFVREGFLTENHEDFVLDTSDISPPPESSWLQVGGVFSGSQHAAHGCQHSRLHPWVHSPTANAPPIASGNTPSRAFPTDSRYAWTQGPNDSRPLPVEEKWPVKVTIHSVDYNNMTLAGTMEAFNVPDASSPTRKSSIVTFLEGEIIDFNTYTLETKSFSADAKIDGTYWRMLEPFKRLSDDEIVRNLVSKKWLTEELAMNWILMRWKEKCFITPSDYRSGLTISGFYYVSLRRDNGHVEGLYHDPSSSPYQQLIITPEKKMFPTYEFR